MLIKIVPSIIGSSQKEMDQMIKKVSPYVSLVQLDIMDGKFVKNKSLWFDFKLKDRRIKYEAHLMVKEPERWMQRYGSRVNSIIFPYESVREEKKVFDLIKKIKTKKKKAGIAINPETARSNTATVKLLIP